MDNRTKKGGNFRNFLRINDFVPCVSKFQRRRNLCPPNTELVAENKPGFLHTPGQFLLLCTWCKLDLHNSRDLISNCAELKGKTPILWHRFPFETIFTKTSKRGSKFGIAKVRRRVRALYDFVFLRLVWLYIFRETVHITDHSALCIPRWWYTVAGPIQSEAGENLAFRKRSCKKASRIRTFGSQQSLFINLNFSPRNISAS